MKLFLLFVFFHCLALASTYSGSSSFSLCFYFTYFVELFNSFHFFTGLDAVYNKAEPSNIVDLFAVDTAQNLVHA